MIYDQRGNRKYLTALERQAFIRAAESASAETETFCLVLALTGARISEVLALTPSRIDFANCTVTFESLKKRRKGVFRSIPLPTRAIERIDLVHDLRAAQINPIISHARIFTWCRTTAWKRVVSVMRCAGLHGPWATPRGLRHGFGVLGTVDAQIPLTVMQRWLGHARIETTLIYTNAVGNEERELARRMW